MSSYTAIVILLLSLALIVAFVHFASFNNTLDLPPGPRKRIIIGNLLDMPSRYTWKKFREWDLTFGREILSGPFDIRSF
jgi:hypothetical protein